MKQKGSMTVFFCLITVLISALISTCIESARTAGLRLMAQTAAGSALQSVFADYRSGLYVILLSDATLCAKKKYGKDAYGEVMKMRARIHSAIKLDLGEI